MFTKQDKIISVLNDIAGNLNQLKADLEGKAELDGLSHNIDSYHQLFQNYGAVTELAKAQGHYLEENNKFYWGDLSDLALSIVNSLTFDKLSEEGNKVALELSKNTDTLAWLLTPTPNDKKGFMFEGPNSDFDLQRLELLEFKNSQLEHDKKIKKLLNENENRVERLTKQTSHLKTDVDAKLIKLGEMYEEALTDIDEKKEVINDKNKQIDDVLRIASGKALISDFSKSAESERKAANWLRRFSIFFMLLIVGIVGYSFWETTLDSFQWQTSSFRIVLAVMLSVPAAYLARESAKHREQQYFHLQTSLDLATITPYIASLPEEDQNKIKVDVASRLFGAKDFSRASADSYPVNVHEVVMELIKKIEPNKS